MRAFITVIDDNREVICKDYVLEPVKEEIVDTNPLQVPTKKTRFIFEIIQPAHFQNKKEAEDERHFISE